MHVPWPIGRSVYSLHDSLLDFFKYIPEGEGSRFVVPRSIKGKSISVYFPSILSRLRWLSPLPSGSLRGTLFICLDGFPLRPLDLSEALFLSAESSGIRGTLSICWVLRYPRYSFYLLSPQIWHCSLAPASFPGLFLSKFFTCSENIS